MIINFNLQNTGAGNNGGTATLFHSANVLEELGHHVNVVSDIENYFTWFKLKGATFIKAYGSDYPDADVNVATGAGSVKHVLKAPRSKGKKFWWIRGHETWIATAEDLLIRYKQPKIQKMVNSECLRRFIKRTTGKNLPVIRPGLDFDVFHRTVTRDWLNKKEIVIGALYTERPSKRFKWLPYICKGLKNSGIDYRFKIFGTWEDPIGLEYDEYLEKPSPKKLSEFYNSIDFWIAPTKTEGLHMPPQEAMLCGCVVIGAVGELNGMNDYIEHEETGFLVNHPDDVLSILKRFHGDKVYRGEVAQKSVAGTYKVLSLGDRRTNMQLMVDHFKRTE